ncbi:hypothetical protein GGF32_005526 [Allomyces javanicus]|nr:hypothetical protein GGF32_005526 [Allomyces javanicus]
MAHRARHTLNHSPVVDDVLADETFDDGVDETFDLNYLVSWWRHTPAVVDETRRIAETTRTMIVLPQPRDCAFWARQNLELLIHGAPADAQLAQQLLYQNVFQGHMFLDAGSVAVPLNHECGLIEVVLQVQREYPHLALFVVPDRRSPNARLVAWARLVNAQWSPAAMRRIAQTVETLKVVKERVDSAVRAKV